MSSLPSRPPASPFARFEGAKTRYPILVRNRGVLDALIIAALDARVRAILPADPVTVTVDGVPFQHVPDCRLLAGGQDIVVDIHRLSRAGADHGRFEAVAAALAEQGIPYERRDPPQAFGVPLLTNSRAVWGCRRVMVSAADQVRALDAVKAGPLPLAEAARAVRDSDGITTILALACRDLLELDLTTVPLGPETEVRRRSAETAFLSEGGN